MSARLWLCASLILPTLAHAQTSLFTNVAPAFKPGPYSFLKVDSADPERFVVGSPEGWVMETRDGGTTVHEAQALLARMYYPNVLRGTGGNHGSVLGTNLPRTAQRQFMALMRANITPTRWASWMSLEDPSTEIFDIALPLAGGHGALAGPAGVFISDERMGVWSRAIGFPRPKGNVTVGLSVAFDPANPNLLFAGTNEGFFMSTNGGASFRTHPDAKLADEAVRQIIWDAKTPDNVLLLAGETVYKSENHGESFEAVLSGQGEVHAIAAADEGVYVATQKGLSLYGGEGTKEMFKDEESVVGVVPVGDGAVLAATETSMYLIGKDGRRALMNTTAADPFVKLSGSAELAWALTKYGIFRVGVKEPRATKRARTGPQMLMTVDEVQAAALKYLGVGDPTKSRLNDRWYASLLPQVTVELAGGVLSSTGIQYDATFPINYLTANASNSTGCCGGVSWNNIYPSQPVDTGPMVMAHWDLAKILFGAYGNVSNPNGMVESSLRNFRVKILEEVRWRYREIRNLCAQLRFPPTDAKVRMLWRMRLEEYANYLEAVSGKKVVELQNMEEVDEAQD